MNTYCRPLSSGKRFVEQIFFTQSDVGLRSLGIVIDFGNQTWRMHHFFSRWVSLPQSYEHSSSFSLTTEDSVNTESPTLCTIERAGCYAKRKVRSAFFPRATKLLDYYNHTHSSRQVHYLGNSYLWIHFLIVPASSECFWLFHLS